VEVETVGDDVVVTVMIDSTLMIMWMQAEAEEMDNMGSCNGSLRGCDKLADSIGKKTVKDSR
jgi:hypothetical protein